MTDHTGTTSLDYYYEINGHGDVTGLRDANGNLMVTYEYDAFGNITSAKGTKTTADGKLLRKVNPFRYASYFYDEETGLYYLMSRYYNAYVGRFLTRDVIPNKNLYAYAENSPVNYVDPNGEFIVPVLIWIGEFLASEVALLATTTVGSSIIAMDIKDNYTAANDFYNNPSWITGAYLGINFIPGPGDDFAKGGGKIVNGFTAILHSGKQGKHILGHPNYQTGKSILTGNAQKLLDSHAGKGQWIGQNKERVNFGKVIGKYVDPKTGVATDTTKGIIHYSNKGAHIVPARP